MSMPKTTRREWLAAGVVLVVLAAVGFSYVHGRLLYYSDSRTYIEGAESLLAGQGYCVGGKPAVTWPPGYAAILSIPMAMGLGKVAVYKVINLLLALGALAFWWRAFRRMSDKGTALLAAAVGGLFFPWIYYSQTILAELLLAFFVGGAFLAATRYADDERTGDLVWLTLFAMLTPLVKMAGPKITYPFEPHWIQCAGAAVSPSGRIQFRGRGQPKDTPELNVQQEVQCLISACAMFEKSLWEEIGGLDEVFNPIEFEDLDFCYRARSKGYKILYVPSVEIYHWESVTSEGTAALPNTYLIVKHGVIFKKRWRHMFEMENGPSDEECKWKPIEMPGLDGTRVR